VVARFPNAVRAGGRFDCVAHLAWVTGSDAPVYQGRRAQTEARAGAGFGL